VIQVSFREDGIVVDAALVAAAFGLPPASVPDRMRSGEITGRCEAGVGEDSGRWRLTLIRGDRALQLVVAPDGRVLSRVQGELDGMDAAAGEAGRRLPVCIRKFAAGRR
jgi:hypothetical protein